MTRNSGKSSAIGGLVCIVGCASAAAQGAPPPPAVTVAPVVTRQVAQTGDFIGRVTAINKVDVVARVAGFIEERNFTEGQQVKKGDLLFRIEQDTYKAAVDQQRANLAKAKATEVNTALQLERGKELVRNSNIPQATVDQRAADDAAAKADVMQAQALLEQAEINLGYTEIRSPIDGRIGLATFTEGNLVQPSSGTLATIVSQDPIYVSFPVSERDVIAYRARVAQSPDKTPQVTIHITLPNGNKYEHPGQTNFLAGSPSRRWWFRNLRCSSTRPGVTCCWSTRPRRSSCAAYRPEPSAAATSWSAMGSRKEIWSSSRESRRCARARSSPPTSRRAIDRVWARPRTRTFFTWVGTRHASPLHDEVSDASLVLAAEPHPSAI